jgi:Arc/MetJ family transcription regulator
MLTAAARIFGTTTKVATVNAVLEDAVKRRRREGLFPLRTACPTALA